MDNVFWHILKKVVKSYLSGNKWLKTETAKSDGFAVQFRFAGVRVE